MISQNVLNLVDTAMVGQVGVVALASVGLGSFLNFFCSALVMGLSIGVQTQCARLRGAGDQTFASPLNGGLLLSTLISAPLCVIVVMGTPLMMSCVTEHPEIASEGGAYLQARLLGLVAIGINFSFRSYWSAVEKTLIYLCVLLVMHSCNIFLNWVLIFGNLGAPALGVQGAGIGTAISMWIGVALYTLIALKVATPYGFLKKLPTRTQWREQWEMSIPSGIERMFFALGMTFFMMILGWVGTLELAASNIILNLFLTAILPAMAFGIASATLIAKSMGARQEHLISIWRRDVSLWAAIVLSIIGVIFFSFAPQITQFFTTDPETAQLVIKTLKIMAFALPVEALYAVTHQSLLGMGDNRFVMTLSLTMQWMLMLPLMYLFGVVYSFGITWIWVIHFIGRGLTFVGLSYRWRLHQNTWSLKLPEGVSADE